MTSAINKTILRLERGLQARLVRQKRGCSASLLAISKAALSRAVWSGVDRSTEYLQMPCRALAASQRSVGSTYCTEMIMP